MKSIPTPLSFQWDKGNENKNWIIHFVSRKEAEEVFFDIRVLLFDDPNHSKTEKRMIVWGRTRALRLLVIAFTIRGYQVRIISARDMSRKERRLYEQKIETNS